jgi:hypothetical protein
MSWVDLFSIDTFTASGREVPEAAVEDGDGEGGGPAVEVAEAPELGGDEWDAEWDAETLDEIPEVDEIGEAVHDDPPLPAHALLRPRTRLWSRPGSHSGA